MLGHSQAVDFLKNRTFSVLLGSSTILEAAKGATILFVEDDPDCVESYLHRIQYLAPEIFWAFDLELGRQAFDLLGDRLKVIVFDYNLGGENSIALIRHVKEAGFKGPMIAASGLAQNREQQRLAGCTVEASEKREVADILRRLLVDKPENEHVH